MVEKEEDILFYIMELLQKMSDSYIAELSEDFSPTLGGNLKVGGNSIVYDTTPSGNVLHGYTVGWSGETSYMNIQRNDAGFGCPLYLNENGKWAQCESSIGRKNMPCVALALEENTGTKQILWKGIVRKDSWSWKPGKMIYVSTVEGALTDVKPEDTFWVQCIGLALTSKTIRFDPGFYSGYVTL